MVERELINNRAKSREYDFDQPVVSVGSHPDNDITLTGPGVLPFHATVVLEAGQYRLIPMEPGSQISVDGVQVQAAQVDLETSQRVEIGNNALFFQHNGSPSSMRVKLFQLAGEDDLQQFTMEGGENAILLNVFSDESEIDVDQTAVFEFEVINAGPIVASFYVALKASPKEWVEISPELINLNEGQRHLVQISVTPPREASSNAGLHTLQVVVNSPNYTGQRALADLSLTIRPYYEFTVGNLSPKDQRISWRKKTGTAFLPITNQGNGPADFSLLALDDENGCSFDFYFDEDRQLNRQATTRLQAGETIELPIKITPLKNPMFSMRTKRYHYTTNVQIPQNAVSPQVISGSVTRVPLFGWWSIVLGLVAILLALFFILQPNIRSFNVAAGKDVIELGDTTRLDWDVSPFATRLSISNIDPPVSRGQVSRTVAPTQSTTYDLVSGNWLSGLVGLDQKRSLTVLVVPPSPLVNVFEVDKTTISKGQPVNIRWSVSTADEVFLTIDQVVYPLTPEEYSGERQVILEKDALITLEAKSASGSELQSYFVNVVPPFININSFTIWVRPDSAAANPASSPVAATAGGKLFSRVNAPDPNFPVKFVELIPDVASDNGYRVLFNQAVREELNKGEQVMLEWNVEGVDSLQIAPFTEDLPARGSQPFFPQESMNFVMTATSGDLTGIFMLPVKVFDGIPPTAPKIEFFRGTPLKMIGAGEVEFTWSISGEWTKVQLSNANGIIADNLNPVGFKKVAIAASQTIILTAYNNELSSAMPLEIVVDPALLPVGVYFKSAFPATGRFLINQAVSFTVGFYNPELSDLLVDPPVYVEPEIDPTGQVFVTDSVSLCTINLPAKTCELIFTTPGDPKVITASYLGDAVYLSASTDAPYDQYISVISSTVTLTPTYYSLNRTTPANSILTSPISINTSSLSLDTGLFIRIKVTPQGAQLPSPDAGKVNMYICQQNLGGTAVVPGSCLPYGFASVTVPSGGSFGLADIVLESFPKTGTYALLFSYSATGFEPADRIEYNVQIVPLEIYLSLATCTPPTSFTNCEIGTSTPSATKVVFEIRKLNDQSRIPSGLTSPVNAAFEVYEIISSTITNWICQMGVATSAGNNYRVLECTANFSIPASANVRSPDQVYVVFDGTKDPNYRMVPSSFDFDLAVKQNTSVSLIPSNFLNLKVGKLVALTTANGTDGAVQLTNTNAIPQKIQPAGGITVTAQQTGVFAAGVLPLNPTVCSVDPTGQIVTIFDITTDCQVYFKKVGTFNLLVEYAGDSSNYRSGTTTPIPVTVTKQDEVTFSWFYQNLAGGYVAWDLTSILPNVPQNMRLELGGPLTGFSSNSFAGGSLRLAVNDATCGLSGANVTSAGFPNYNVAITNTAIGATPRADFTMLCTTSPRTVKVSAALLNTTDFALKSGEIVEQTLGILNRSGAYTNVSFIREAGAVSMLTGGVPGTMGTLHFGEKYTLQMTVGRLWADSYVTSRQAVINSYIAAQHKATVTFTSGIYNSIDWTKSTCLDMGSNKVGVLLNAFNVVYDFGNPNLGNPGLTDIELYNSTPCILYFDTGFTPVTSGGQSTFGFSILSFSNSRGPITTILDKQSIALTSSPATYAAFVDSPQSSLTVTLAPQVSQTLLLPLNSTFASHFLPDTVTTPCATLGTGSIFSTKIATLPLTPSTAACDDVITVTYMGNNYFKSSTATIPATILLHNPDLSIFSKNNAGNFVAFSSPFPNMKVTESLEMRVNVTKGLTGIANPTGFVYVSMVDSDGVLINPVPTTGTPVYTITTSATVVYEAGTKEYKITINTFQEALFTLNFSAAKTNIRLLYRYGGDAKYYLKNAEAGPMDFKP
jgi:hypothetical protein